MGSVDVIDVVFIVGSKRFSVSSVLYSRTPERIHSSPTRNLVFLSFGSHLVVVVFEQSLIFDLLLRGRYVCDCRNISFTRNFFRLILPTDKRVQ